MTPAIIDLNIMMVCPFVNVPATMLRGSTGARYSDSLQSFTLCMAMCLSVSSSTASPPRTFSQSQPTSKMSAASLRTQSSWHPYALRLQGCMPNCLGDNVISRAKPDCLRRSTIILQAATMPPADSGDSMALTMMGSTTASATLGVCECHTAVDGTSGSVFLLIRGAIPTKRSIGWRLSCKITLHS